MAFGKINGRPCGTEEVLEGVVHYTCNPPPTDTLQRYGIQAIGSKFNVEPNEVLLIPEELFKRYGFVVNTCSAETLLVRIGKERR